jgi:hypothetical protein
MDEKISAGELAAFLLAVFAKTGSLESFIEAAHELFENATQEHIDELHFRASPLQRSLELV